jgi:uncharacterized membrane protein
MTQEANPWYLPLVNPLYRFISLISTLVLLLTPLILLGIWYRYGRERSYTVPDHLSFVPDPTLKPWLVSLIFSGDPGKFPEEGLHATLIDLHRRGVIVIEQPTEKTFTIRVVKHETDDPYEEQVIRILALLSTHGVVTSEMFSKLAADANANESIRHQLVQYQKSFRDLPSSLQDRMLATYIRDGHSYLIPLLAGAIGLFFLSLVLIIVGPEDRFILIQAVYNSSLIALQVIIALLFPVSLFGTWKGDSYQDRLKWESFRHFLSDSVMIQRYSPKDLSIWGDWMVYGTALGVVTTCQTSSELYRFRSLISLQADGLLRLCSILAFLRCLPTLLHPQGLGVLVEEEVLAAAEDLVVEVLGGGKKHLSAGAANNIRNF